MSAIPHIRVEVSKDKTLECSVEELYSSSAAIRRPWLNIVATVQTLRATPRKISQRHNKWLQEEFNPA